MAVAVAIYLAFNAGRSSAHGWGVAMSTDTAFALGLLALVGPRFPDRLRAFMLTVVVVDDIVALVVIATVYTERMSRSPLLVAAVGFFGASLVARAPRRARRASSTRCSGSAAWVALLESGVEPVVVGLAMGLLAYAYPARARRPRARDRALPRVPRAADAGARARRRGAGSGRRSSPNERLQQLFHPWTSYVIVPLFALANAGIAIDGGVPRARRSRSPITLGILFGYVVGKPVGILGASWLLTRLSRGRLRPPVGLGGRRRRRHDRRASASRSRCWSRRSPSTAAQLEEAKLGILSAALGAALLTWLLFRATALLPRRTRIRALLGTRRAAGRPLPRLRPGARPRPRAGRRSGHASSSTATSNAPTAARRSPSSASSCATSATSRYVWRHLPLTDVHPNAQLAAEAAEAAADQGAFWEMHDLLLDHQDALRRDDLIGYAERLGLDVDRFTTTCASAPARRAGRRGRRQRRPQRRLRHPHVLHQRPAPLRRLRHRHALGGGPDRGCTSDPRHRPRGVSGRRLYGLASGRWTPTGAMTDYHGPAAVSLRDGRVLVAGGRRRGRHLLARDPYPARVRPNTFGFTTLIGVPAAYATI